LALGAALVFIGTGCAGISATQTVSPLMFLLPGFAQDKSNSPLPDKQPAPVAVSNTFNQSLASLN
jgi:hypothetical protein